MGASASGRVQMERGTEWGEITSMTWLQCARASIDGRAQSGAREIGRERNAGDIVRGGRVSESRDRARAVGLTGAIRTRARVRARANGKESLGRKISPPPRLQCSRACNVGRARNRAGACGIGRERNDGDTVGCSTFQYPFARCWCDGREQFARARTCGRNPGFTLAGAGLRARGYAHYGRAQTRATMRAGSEFKST